MVTATHVKSEVID